MNPFISYYPLIIYFLIFLFSRVDAYNPYDPPIGQTIKLKDSLYYTIIDSNNNKTFLSLSTYIGLPFETKKRHLQLPIEMSIDIYLKKILSLGLKCGASYWNTPKNPYGLVDGSVILNFLDEIYEDTIEIPIDQSSFQRPYEEISGIRTTITEYKWIKGKGCRRICSGIHTGMFMLSNINDIDDFDKMNLYCGIALTQLAKNNYNVNINNILKKTTTITAMKFYVDMLYCKKASSPLGFRFGGITTETKGKAEMNYPSFILFDIGFQPIYDFHGGWFIHLAYGLGVLL